jgi:hypothetical protein
MGGLIGGGEMGGKVKHGLTGAVAAVDERLSTKEFGWGVSSLRVQVSVTSKHVEDGRHERHESTSFGTISELCSSVAVKLKYPEPSAR